MFGRRFISRAIIVSRITPKKPAFSPVPWASIRLSSGLSSAQVETTTGDLNETLKVSELKKMGRINPAIIKSLERANFTSLTPVQTKSMIPILENEQGMVVRAKTGTGKTLAFVVPTLQSIIETIDHREYSNKVSSLVIAPTRDLALQIEREYLKVLKNLPAQLQRKIRLGIMIGGKQSNFQPRFPPHVVIATPGRLNANLQNPNIAKCFSSLKYRIYDEADRILDQGFADELENIDEILKLVNQAKFKSVLFSATVDDSVDNFARDQIANPYKFINCVDENEPEAHENIYQKLVITEDVADSFASALSYIARSVEDPKFKAIVFLPTVTGADWFLSALNAARRNELYDTALVHSKYRSSISKLHGKMSQAARDRTVRRFREAKHGVLVCTDVAARGLDFQDVTDVIQMTPSATVADYIHKIGRTARAGAKGKATTFLAKNELRYISALERERGVKFSEEIKAHELEDKVEDIFKYIIVNEEESEEFMKSFLAFQKQVAFSYNLRISNSIAATMELYRKLVQDPEAKLHVGGQFISSLLKADPDMADKYFTYPKGLRPSYSNNRKSKRDTFRADGHGASKRNDRFKNYNNKRFSNSRGYDNDRSYKNDGNDRGFKSYGSRNDGYSKRF